MLDVALGLISCGLEKIEVIVASEMRLEQGDGRERQRALRDHFENHRKLPRRPRGLDPMVGGVLGEVQHRGAVREERRARLREIETSRVELGEEREQVGRQVTLVRGGACSGVEQIVVR